MGASLLKTEPKIYCCCCVCSRQAELVPRERGSAEPVGWHAYDVSRWPAGTADLGVLRLRLCASCVAAAASCVAVVVEQDASEV